VLQKETITALKNKKNYRVLLISIGRIEQGKSYGRRIKTIGQTQSPEFSFQSSPEGNNS
jgi:hypothetical protein